MLKSKFFKYGILDPLKAFPIFVFYAISALLPIRLSSLMLGKLARLLGPLLKVHKRGLENLRAAFPEKPESEIQKIIGGVWENLGRVVGEFPHVYRIARDPKMTVIKNLDVLKKHGKENQPVLFMAGHLGNWEIPHYVVVHHHIPIALISRPPNNFYTKKLFDAVRSHPLVDIFFKGSQGSRQMMAHLKAKKKLGILFDQRLHDGTPLPFFGRPALTALGPAKLAQKYGAAVVPVQVRRTKSGPYFEVTFHEPVDTNCSAEELMSKLNQHLESWVREAPEQWLWLHKRWKS